MFLQFLRGEVDNVMSGVGQQQQLTSQVLDQLKSYVPKVQSAWIGGDADAFANDVATILVPAMMDLIAAIGGVNTNLSSATNIIDQADQKCLGMANQLGDVFGGIMGGGGGGGGGGLGGMLGGIGGALGGGGGLGF
jgi:uncharacterized protein YukE